MKTKGNLGIEISDLGITAACSAGGGVELIPLDGEGLELSGFAQLTGNGEVFFGKAAFQQFLTSAVPVDNQYWYRLAGMEDPSSGKLSRNQPADSELAQAHLTAVFEKCLQVAGSVEEVTLAVPGHFKSSQLGSLLQITGAIGMPVNHVLDSSLASLLSMETVPDGESFLFFDLHWNTAELTQVSRGANSIERLNVNEDRRLGLRQLLSRLIDGLGKRFIDECRFDPAARPEYAQALYNQVMEYLAGGAMSNCKLDTPKGSITVDGAALADMIPNELKSLSGLLGRTLNELGTDSSIPVLLSSRVRLIPGLEEQLTKEHPITPVKLASGQAASGALTFLQAVSGRGTTDHPLFHTRIEYAVSSVDSGSQSSSKLPGKRYRSGPNGILQSTPPSHILFQGRLLALPGAGEEDFVIGKSRSITTGLTIVEPVDGLADWHVCLRRTSDGELQMINNGRNQTFVNGREIASNDSLLLQTGDVLELGSSVLQLMIAGVALEHA